MIYGQRGSFHSCLWHFVDEEEEEEEEEAGVAGSEAAGACRLEDDGRMNSYSCIRTTRWVVSLFLKTDNTVT